MFLVFAVRLAERVLVAVVLLETLARQDASDRPLLELDAVRACAENMTLTDGTSREPENLSASFSPWL